jgi:hypothetical protein
MSVSITEALASTIYHGVLLFIDEALVIYTLNHADCASAGERACS